MQVLLSLPGSLASAWCRCNGLRKHRVVGVHLFARENMLLGVVWVMVPMARLVDYWQLDWPTCSRASSFTDEGAGGKRVILDLFLTTCSCPFSQNPTAAYRVTILGCRSAHDSFVCHVLPGCCRLRASSG